ncbi:TIM barrel protein [Mangrovicoccus algicola]|uniref:TIM barrel protein n=1 Tax=Mangrovicoccus algicola TaxID=2771008 RepID=A0A8J6Z7W9_9RHOB|nr:TIM barrel protein [Mangrovicoccus algicola]MBE3639594.1 TIM barrel protein [Mangrovicoccus algicola]
MRPLTAAADRAAPAPLPIGCNGRGAQASSPACPVSFAEPPLAEQFAMVAGAGVFDFFDRLPMEGQVDAFRALSADHHLPAFTASGVYALGPGYLPMLRANMARAVAAGAKFHNMMVFAWHSEGRWVTDDEVIRAWAEAWEAGEAAGIEPCFELHVNMWSEDPRRVATVARAAERLGIPFNLTLDYSHMLFKMGDPAELEVSGIRGDVEAGRLVLDPYLPGNLVDEWLEMGIVRWFQLRSVTPAGPRNLWSHHDSRNGAAGVPDDPNQRARDGAAGRAILYPFTRPGPGEWHSPWEAWRLEPCKEVARKVLAHHAASPDSRLAVITTEMINLTDYGDGAKFSLIGQNAAIAAFLRAEMRARGIPEGLPS